MDEREIKETPLWELYGKCLDYARMHNLFADVDKCNRFYNNDQWYGLKYDGIEPVSLNFITPIVKYKVGLITESLRAINYNADNIDSTQYRLKAKKICELLNQRASRVWERNQMDFKLKKIVKKSAIVSEGIIYNFYDEENNDPMTEILNKTDVFYGNENDSDIQSQPFIIIKRRKPVVEAINIANTYSVSKDDLELIRGDKETSEQSGDSSKTELDDMVTILTKFYKVDGKIYFTSGTKYVTFIDNADSGYELYPLAHFLWEEKEGSARGESEVKPLIHNQIETNKTLMRRLLTAKNTAYPQKIYLEDKISNPNAINAVGGIIKAKGNNLDDVNKVFATTKPAQMSPDVAEIQKELISTTRELSNASDTATGQVNPEQASGKAILAVQHASQQPLNDQNNSLNTFIEDIAKIWFEMWKVHNQDGMQLESIDTDPLTSEETVKIEKVRATELDKLKATVKIDITPKGAYDKYAQEISLENLAKSEFFMNNAWLEDYISLLDTDSVMPKLKLEDLVNKRKEAQKRIQEIQRQANMMQSYINQGLNTNQIMPKEMQKYNPNDVEQISNMMNQQQAQPQAQQ